MSAADASFNASRRVIADGWLDVGMGPSRVGF
jgi:hypothetical protein